VGRTQARIVNERGLIGSVQRREDREIGHAVLLVLSLVLPWVGAWLYIEDECRGIDKGLIGRIESSLDVEIEAKFDADFAEESDSGSPSSDLNKAVVQHGSLR
jgi:hypothetical protein